MRKLFLFIFVYLFLSGCVYAEPASLSFEPIDIKAHVGDIIEVKVNIYTGDTIAASSDVYVNYNPAYLEALPDKTQNGNLFSSIDSKIINSGKLYLAAIEEDKNRVKPEVGTMAKIYFKAIRETQTQLSFECNEYGTKTSQIIKGDSTLANIISCPSTVAHTIKVEIKPQNAILGAQSVRGANILTYLGIFLVIIGLSYMGFSIYQRKHISH